jgi:Lar family restriction alleviation protein
MNNTLLPCPFCGGIGTLWSIDQCDTVYAVCQDCGARTVDYKHAEEAIAAWNRRVDVAPVVRGEWIEHEDEMECPQCGYFWNYCDNDTERFNYCPNCGCDMRGERDGEK